DAILYCKSIDMANHFLNLFSSLCKQLGLTINYNKTYYGYINVQNETHKLIVDNHSIHPINNDNNSNRYLGYYFNGNNIEDNQIQVNKLIEKTKLVINQLKHELFNKQNNENINISTIVKIYKSLIKTKLTYGAEITYLSEKERKILERVQ